MNFDFHAPTQIFFGTEALSKLPEGLAGAERILLCTGGQSIHRNGIYDRVMAQVGDRVVAELSGIMPNPRTEKVEEGRALCLAHQVDWILAVGGGSVIDCAKAVAAAACYEGDFWQHFYIERQPCLKALPIGTVLTLSGTGSEFNGNSVISKWDEDLKYGYGSPLLIPRFSCLDPSTTLSLPKEQMIAGTIDCLSHLFEQYFSGPEEPNVTDRLAECLMREAMQHLDLALENPEDLNPRANLMWIASLALNHLMGCGKTEDWMSHQIEHALSAFYDVTHGLGLAVVHPVYLWTVRERAPERFSGFAERVMNVPSDWGSVDERGREGIRRLRQRFHDWGAPTTLGELGIPLDRLKEIAAKTKRFKTDYSDLDDQGIEAILRLAAEPVFSDQ